MSFRCSKRDFNTMRRKSDSMLRSWTSISINKFNVNTIKIWKTNFIYDDMLWGQSIGKGTRVDRAGWRTVTSSKAEARPPPLLPLPSSILNAIPFVTNVKRVFFDVTLSSRIEYPTKDDIVPTEPTGSPNSWDTRCAREIAEIRRGSVTIILHGIPVDNCCSRMKEGSWVDLPLFKKYEYYAFLQYKTLTIRFLHWERLLVTDRWYQGLIDGATRSEECYAGSAQRNGVSAIVIWIGMHNIFTSIFWYAGERRRLWKAVISSGNIRTSPRLDWISSFSFSVRTLPLFWIPHHHHHISIFTIQWLTLVSIVEMLPIVSANLDQISRFCRFSVLFLWPSNSSQKSL